MKIRGTVVKVVLLAATALALSGCNTLSGVGQDLRVGGRAVERAAN